MAVFPGGQPRLQSWGRGPSITNCLRLPTCAHTVWEKATRFWMVIKLDERKLSQRRPRPAALAKLSVTKMLTRDLYAVANLQHTEAWYCSGIISVRLSVRPIMVLCWNGCVFVKLSSPSARAISLLLTRKEKLAFLTKSPLYLRKGTS